MAYTPDAVLAKLSALNETQESIVTVAQWVMFHRRHAETTVQLWLQRLKDSGANKRLNLIYLANEVVQQSKVRKKHDFLVAFSPIITEATTFAYRGASYEVQQKLRRVLEVWRQRQIFELPIQDAIEARVSDLDKSRTNGKKSLLGGSLMPGAGGTIPAEIQSLVPLQSAVSKLAAGKASTLADANQEYDKLVDPTVQDPAPPVHAARLSGLLKSLASAEGAVAESIKARRELIQGLEKMLEKNRNMLQLEENEEKEIAQRKAATEEKKRDVEDSIMRGLAEESPNNFADTNGSAMGGEHDTEHTGGLAASAEPEAPDVEALTPPPVESSTPPGRPAPFAHGGYDGVAEVDDGDYEPPAVFHDEAANVGKPLEPLIPAPPSADQDPNTVATSQLSILNVSEQDFSASSLPATSSTNLNESTPENVPIPGSGATKRKMNDHHQIDDDAYDVNGRSKWARLSSEPEEQATVGLDDGTTEVLTSG